MDLKSFAEGQVYSFRLWDESVPILTVLHHHGTPILL